MKSIHYIFYKHKSLLLLALFSICYFASMVISKKLLSVEDFYFWNSFITLIAISFTFCFLGAEQLFLRYSILTDSGVSISKSTLCVMGVGLTLFSVSLTVLIETYFFRLDSNFTYIITTLCVSVSVFTYNFFRLMQHFSTSQLAANSWKLFLLISVCATPLGYAPWIIIGGLAVSSIVTTFLFWRNRHRLQLTSGKLPDDWYSLFVGFFLSLLALMLLNNVDRLLMTRYTTPELFSEYVYLVTLLLMPFSLLSNYIGFKETALLKKSYCRRDFLKKTGTVAVVSATLFIFWFIIIYKLQLYLEVSVKLSYFLPCLAIVISRSTYALLSALFGLKGAVCDIHWANFLTLTIILIGIYAILAVELEITKVFYLSAIFFFTRMQIFFFFILKIR